jgi:hypothetical protein
MTDGSRRIPPPITDHSEKAERYWALMRKYQDLAEHAEPPFLGDFYRKVARRYGAMAKEAFDLAHAMAQRVGMQIAELPIKIRDVAFAGTERCLRAAGAERGVAGQQLDRIVDRQMRAIRQIVTDIDLSGSPQGGRA